MLEVHGCHCSPRLFCDNFLLALTIWWHFLIGPQIERAPWLWQKVASPSLAPSLTVTIVVLSLLRWCQLLSHNMRRRSNVATRARSGENVARPSSIVRWQICCRAFASHFSVKRIFVIWQCQPTGTCALSTRWDATNRKPSFVPRGAAFGWRGTEWRKLQLQQLTLS